MEKKILCTRPDFIGFGMRRCATSWLHRVLGEHPEIFKPPKGLHFFNQNYYRDIKWYTTELSRYISSGKSGLVGEFSTTYSYPRMADTVAERIHRLFPDVKLIASIRNPIDRCYSDYLRGLKRKEIPNIPFNKAILEDSELIERGFYAPILRSFQKRFSREQMLILRYDDILSNPGLVIEALYGFLGVNRNFEPSVLTERVGETYSPKRVHVEWMLNALQRTGGQLGRAMGLESLVNFAKKRGALKKLHSLNIDKNSKLKNSEVFNRLALIYREDIQETMTISGMDLRQWLGENQ